MAEPSPTLVKLKDYLRSLPQATRGFLIAQLQASTSAGKDIPGADFILNALQQVEADLEAEAALLGSPLSFLFDPLHPFIADGVGEKKMRGQIHRPSIEQIGIWLSRDAASDEFKAYSEEIKAALRAKNDASAKVIAFQFQTIAAKIIDNHLSSINDDASRRRFIAQLGGDRAFDDLKDVAAIFRARDAISAIGKRLPKNVKTLSDDTLETCYALLATPSVRSPDIFPFAITLLFSRLAIPVQIIRLALKAAESDSPVKMLETPFSLCVDLVLTRMEALSVRVKSDMQKEKYDIIVPLLKEMHDIGRGLRSEIDLSSDSAWSRRLSHVRSEIADCIKPVLDGMPGHIRRLLRIHPPGDRHHIKIDNDEIVTLENQLDFLIACRNVAGELSLNEVTRRVFGEVQSYLDSQPTALIESLRSAQGDDTRALIGQIDTCVRLCTRLFGASYAQLLQKSADVVINGEKKTAKG